MKTSGVLLACLFYVAKADIYLHNPRGSNNRLDESGRARTNANRLFDSQNNDRGGYNVGGLYYYEGSKLSIEWTNQHSCQSANNHCELIIQYMCGDNVRDGITTKTIPDNPEDCENYDCNTDTRYGMHEDFDYYLRCKLRLRNQGLFTADQNLKGRTRAKNTRQNPAGTRRGYECPEERDYYPYWHPTPWKDIVVMTNNATRCPYYQAESENVKGRWACIIPETVVMLNIQKGLEIPNNKEDCDAFRWPKNDPNGATGVWTQLPSHNLPPPDCRETEFTRDNHLGNGLGGYPNLYNWTIPDINHEHCVIRIRYNISTQDYEAWDDVDASNNQRKNKGPADIDLSPQFGLGDQQTAAQRGYVFENNPEVQIFPELPNMKLRLAINTAQFGRTFQDRSHTFAVRRRPESLEGVPIYNVNVRGKRGNIVQVYPAVEYDFVPNTLELSTDDCVHFQWTGSNTNPHNNDGQGQAGSDRSNVVLQGYQAYDEGTGLAYTMATKFGHWGRSYPELVQNTTFLGLSEEDLMHLALLTPGQFRGEMSELDDAGTYFDLGPRKVTRSGTYHYMCTRNNNFSNRSQKGRIICRDGEVLQDSIGWNGGSMSLNDGKAVVKVDRGAFAQLQKMRIEEWSPEQGEALIQQKQKEIPISNNFAGPFIVIQPETQLAAEGKTFTVEMNVDSGGMEDISVYRTSSDAFVTWTKVDAKVSNGVAAFQTQEGGVYVAVKHYKGVMIALTVLAIVILVALVVGATVFYARKHPDKFQFVKRSFQSKV